MQTGAGRALTLKVEILNWKERRKGGKHLKEEETASNGSLVPRVNHNLTKNELYVATLTLSEQPFQVLSNLDMLSIASFDVNRGINIKLHHLNVALLGGQRVMQILGDFQNLILPVLANLAMIP